VSRLNYHHLLYFWSVAKHGSVAAAAKRLHLAQPTISAQVRSFERSLGHVLLAREGRGLALTAMGRTVFRFADEIFTLGSELLDAVRGHEPSSRVVLRVGVVDVLPKLLVYRMLRPVLALPENLRLVCYEGKLSDLAARLAVHDLDVVLADVPLTPQAGVRAFSHRLGEASLGVFAAPPRARHPRQPARALPRRARESSRDARGRRERFRHALAALRP
jgi:LysR family transcriptional activator of nhaA